MQIEQVDLLILGSGGAGLFAALHAYDTNPQLSILVATKGLLGKSGCTRMVQGGFNVVLDPRDSLELHFTDTLKGGRFLNDQELAWVLVHDAPATIHELETRVGCFFDRREDGTIHQKPFAGQSFDRTVHRGDLTGIEIMERLRDQVLARGIPVWEEHRAVELMVADGRCVGALLLDIRQGRFVGVEARATLLATGGGPTMYKISAPSLEKSEDGLALAYRAGAVMRDMEMVQFHPTGLLAGAGRVTGSVLEEGLRGAGGRLYNALGERYMARYDPERMERATRDVVSRAGYLEIMAGRGGPQGGVFIDVSHLGADFVRKTFPGMVQRVRDVGFDLATGPVEVSPTAHFHMGGVAIDPDGHSSLPGLYVAGEDAGGVHGANRLGGNGVAESTVFGRRVGDALGREAAALPRHHLTPQEWEDRARYHRRFWERKGGENPAHLLQELRQLMWEKCGLVRNQADLQACLVGLGRLRERLEAVSVAGSPSYNLRWGDALNLESLITVSELIAAAALLREESRGSHFRADFPQENDGEWLKNIFMVSSGDATRVWTEPVRFTRLRPPGLEVGKEDEAQHGPRVAPRTV
jgi:succinate dehydrogenase/fumarate reductase flavoprotein subunit